METIKNIFESSLINQDLLRKIEGFLDPKIKYMIAITPRSGSSYLSDVIESTKMLGNPGEFFPVEFIKNIIKNAPAKNPDDYLTNVLKLTQTSNSVAGVKTSWYQFQNFFNEVDDKSVFNKFKYIYLVRQDVTAQAISLYKATQSSLFHTNIDHSEEIKAKNESLDYDYRKIKKWFDHIKSQEEGWQNFFVVNNIHPLYITYEEIDDNVALVVNKIATYLSISSPFLHGKEVPTSVFRKIGNSNNLDWAKKYFLDDNRLSNFKDKLDT